MFYENEPDYATCPECGASNTCEKWYRAPGFSEIICSECLYVEGWVLRKSGWVKVER
jgi:hypothetical protein